MKYYIFRVKDDLGQDYYILNNQYIGYLGIDTNVVRSIMEQAPERKYQLYAQSDCVEDNGLVDRELHKLNCASTRFTAKEVKALIKEMGVFKAYKGKEWYREYFPSRNSSKCWLREVDGTREIK
jgi:hypothetical protein